MLAAPAHSMDEITVWHEWVRVVGRGTTAYGNADHALMLADWPTKNRICRIRFHYAGLCIEHEAWNFFETFARVRLDLEELDLFPYCYGASLNVTVTAIDTDMGEGLRVRRLVMGLPSDALPMVGIFDDGEDVTPSTVAEQNRFREVYSSL